MTKKLKYLIIINLVLLVAIAFSLIDTDSNTTLNSLETQFALTDSSLVQQIVLGENVLDKQQDGSWTINNKYLADQRRITFLLGLLQRVTIKRPASTQVAAQISKAIESQGIAVKTLDANGQELLSFKMIGQEEETYAALAGAQPYIIHIPGVPIEIANWFAVDQAEWRDRHVLFTTFRTLKKLAVNYPKDAQSSFQIQFDNNFYQISGVDKLDSVAVFNYISQFQDFQVSRFVPKRPSLADSLSLLEPLSVISIEDLYSERDNKLSVYPTEEALYGVLEKDKEIVLISPRALESLMIAKEQFKRKEE